MLKEMNLKKGIFLCAIGLAVIGLGSINEKYITIRYAGLIILLGGMITVGKRTYERFQERIKEKRERLKSIV